MRRGLSQGGRWLFKKGVRDGKKRLQEDPLWVQRSSPQSLRRRAPPCPILLQPDFGREQNPKRPVGFHHTPPRPRAGKVKIWGSDIATCHPRSPKGSGTRAGLPPRTPATSLRPPPSPAGAWLPRTPAPRRRPPRQSSGRLQKRDVCRDGSGRRGVPGAGRPPAAPDLPRACASAGPTWSLATRRICGGGGCARPAAAWPSVRPWGRGRGLGGGGAGRGRHGDEWGRRRRREGPGRSGRGPPGAGRHLFRVFPRIIDVPLM